MTDSAAERIVIREEWANALQAGPLCSFTGDIQVVNLPSLHMSRLLANLAQSETLHPLAESILWLLPEADVQVTTDNGHPAFPPPLPHLVNNLTKALLL